MLSRFSSFCSQLFSAPPPTQFSIPWTGSLIGPVLIQSTAAQHRVVMYLLHCPEASPVVLVSQADTLKGVEHSCYGVGALIALDQ